jgi:hypothetical protein
MGSDFRKNELPERRYEIGGNFRMLIAQVLYARLVALRRWAWLAGFLLVKKPGRFYPAR